jgi:hypothetical protein
VSDAKKKKRAFFSGLSVMKKFAFLDLLLVIAVAIICSSMISIISSISGKNYNALEKTAVTATEQLTTMTVETAVSIAKNIYTNEPIYTFLNKRYKSSSEYFEEYYPLQENTALNIADVNIVRKCTIYTSNDTITPGGTVRFIDEAKSESWYKTIKDLDKSTILSIDPKNHSLILVRRMDYISLDTGESYICLEFNMSIINDFAKSLDFDGQFYIISGNDLLYSNDDEIEDASEISITPEFECITRNYYTFDVNFCSCANKKSIMDFLLSQKMLLPSIVIIFLLVSVLGILMAKGIDSRITPVIKKYRESGDASELKQGENGKDEIGQLLDICAEMTERLNKHDTVSSENNASLLKKSTEYNSLYATAMRLDSELAVVDKVSELRMNDISEYIQIGREVELLGKLAKKMGAEYDCTGIENFRRNVPAYSLVLVLADLFTNYGGLSLKVRGSEKAAEIIFTGKSPVNSFDWLKINAIFEDSDISGVYAFNRNNRYNPYYRLKHCLGNSADVVFDKSDDHKVIFKIYSEKGE